MPEPGSLNRGSGHPATLPTLSLRDFLPSTQPPRTRRQRIAPTLLVCSSDEMSSFPPRCLRCCRVARTTSPESRCRESIVGQTLTFRGLKFYAMTLTPLSNIDHEVSY